MQERRQSVVSVSFCFVIFVRWPSDPLQNTFDPFGATNFQTNIRQSFHLRNYLQEVKLAFEQHPYSWIHNNRGWFVAPSYDCSNGGDQVAVREVADSIRDAIRALLV